MMSRDEAIVKFAYQVPSLITKNLEALIGAEMAREARKAGHVAKLPESRTDAQTTSKTDLKIMGFLSKCEKPMTRGEIAKELNMGTESVNIPLRRLHSRGLLSAEMLPTRRYAYTVKATG